MLNNLPVKIISTIILLLLRMALLSQDQIITPVEIPDSKDFIGRVNCIFQDRIGFIWIGKESGLYRYDGNEMKAFRHDPNDTSTISCNFVRAINEDSLGNLWIGTNGGGLNYYHRKSGKFSRYLHNEKDTNSISFDQLSTIFPDGKGNLWIGTDGGGLNFFDPATGKFRSFRAGENPTKKLKSNKILHISPTTNGKYWLSTWGGGVHLFNPVSKEIKHIGNGTKYKKCNVFCAKEVKPGILWLATFDEGLVEYNIKSAKFTTLIARVGVDSFSDIQVTSSGEIFVASNNGLLFFPSATSECRYVESATSYFYTITAIFIDRTQTLWVGNGPGWIGKINSFKKQFHTLPTSSPFKEASVNAVHIDKISGKTFFAFKNQLIECDLFTNRYQSYDLPFKFFNSMIEIPEMNILLCPSTNGIVLFDKNSGRISPMEFGKNSPIELLKEGIRSFYPADSIGVWVAATSAAYKINFDLESKNWEITNVIPIGTENGISNCHFPTCFLRHPNGDFYIGTKGGGLNRRVAGETKFTFFLHDAVNKRSISDNSIECMVADRKGNIWIGTQAGLNLFDIQTSTFSRLWASDGLTDDYILAIAIDSKNRAWVSTRRGISSVSDDLKTIKNYDITDGLPSNEFLPRSVATDDAGNIYFGSTRGLVWFHPDSIINNPYIPEAVVVDFKIIGKSVMNSDTLPLKQSIELVTDINLNHRQSSFSFQMAAIDYFNPLRNQISYKLDGYDKNWIKARTDQIAIYKNVPSGTYTFSVRASNEDGICNPKERQIKLTISPPFWFSWHAILFYVLLFASGSWYVTHRKKKPEGATSGNSSLSLLKNSNYDFIQPSIIITEPSDQRFIQKVLSQIEENIADKEFGVQQLAKKMNLTRSQLYRRINNITHISVVEFIKVVRLKRAAQLLSQQPENISEVAFQVGFNDLSYFSKCFKYQFGVSPARFLAEQEHVLQSNN